jgi:RecA/RadA recombinase
LNGAIAGVLNHQCAGPSANIEVVVAFVDEEFAWNHDRVLKQWVDAR